VTLALLLKQSVRLVNDFKGQFLFALNDKAHGRGVALSMVWLSMGVILQMVALVLSGSRGASAAVAVAVLGLLLWFISRLRAIGSGKGLAFVVVAMMAGTLIAVTSGFAVVFKRFERLLDADLSMDARMKIWRASLELFEQHPMGVGVGAYREAIPRFQMSGFGDKRFDLAHNDYIQLLCELGWVGIIPVAVIALLCAIRLLKVLVLRPLGPNTWLIRGLFFAALAGLLHAGLDFNLSSRPGVTVTFCVIVGCLLGSTMRERERDATPRRRGSRRKRRSSSSSGSGSSRRSSKGSQKRRSKGKGEGESSSRRGLSESDVVRGAKASHVSSHVSAERKRIKTTEEDEEKERRPRGPRAFVAEETKKTRRKREYRAFIGPVSLLVLLGLLVLGSLGSWYMLKAGKARDAVVRGWQAAGGERYLYQWKYTPRLKEQLAVEELREATGLVPGDGIVHSVLGRTIVLTNETVLARAIEETAARVEERDLSPFVRKIALAEAYKIQLDSQKPSYAEALDYMGQGVHLSPWNPEMHAWYGRYLCVTAMHDADALKFLQQTGTLTPNAKKRIEQGIRHLDTAVTLAPNDTTTLLTATHGWVAAFQAMRGEQAAAARTRIQDFGNKVLQLGSKAREEIIFIWYDAGIGLDEMMEIQDLPLASLRELYALYARADDVPNARRALTLIEQALDKDKPITGLYTTPEGEARYIKSTRSYLTNQRARWQLREGEWDAFAKNKEQRSSFWRNRVALEIDQQKSDQGRESILRQLEKNVGLPHRESLELARIDSEEGQTLSVNRRLLRAAFDPETASTDLMDARWWTETELEQGTAPAGGLVIEARLLAGNGDKRKARSYLKPLFEDRRDEIPVAFRHRIELLDAELQEDNPTQAAQRVRDAFEGSRVDPAVMQSAILLGMGKEAVRDSRGDRLDFINRLAQLTPDIPIHLAFAGQTIELTGIDLQPAENGRASLRAHWRFFDQAPSDLAASLVMKTKDGRVRYSEMKRFKTIAQLDFANGDPRHGVVIPVEFTIPSYHQEGDGLFIYLRRAVLRTYLRTDEGLVGFETWNWRDRIGAAADQPPPKPKRPAPEVEDDDEVR